MIWPFQTIYVTKKLGLSMIPVTLLLTISSLCVLLGSVTFSPLIDRIGRKWIMIGGLLTHAISLIFLSRAHTYLEFALLMGLNGLVSPIYRIAADAMMADLVKPEKRVDGYALLRLSHNLGISVGPAIGGFLAAESYNLIFFGGATGLTIYSLLMLFLARETLPVSISTLQHANLKPVKERLGGYEQIIKDGQLMRFLLSFTMIQFCAVMIWQILPKYAYDNFSIPENLYGWIPTTNAMMVVLFQVLITSRTRRFPPLIISGFGGMFYAFAVGGIAIWQGFWGFWAMMVIMTIGELMIMPTSSTYVSNLAPVDKRGRYMGMYNLSWSLAGITAPIFGGLVTDLVSPKAPWVVGFIFGLAAVTLFFTGYLQERRKPIIQTT
jgi:MFS family permease